MRISIVIPVFNEAATILEVLRRVKLTKYVKQIIIVDDGSTDDTREVLAGIDDPDVEIVLHKRNLGKAAALRTGFARANGDFVIVQDADLEYDPIDYPILLGPLIDGYADVVYGSRFSGQERRVLLFWHTLGNQLLTLLSNLTTNLNLTDMETGYKAFRLNVVKRLKIESSGFDVEPEITSKIARMGLRIYEVPIHYRGRTYAEGKKISWKDGVRAGLAIVRYGLLPSKVSSHHGNDTLSAVEIMDRYNDYLWSRIRPHVGKRVLEAGCGTGTITKFLVERDMLVTADVDGHYLALLRKFSDRPNVKLVQADFSASNLPFAGPFDTVICMNVLEHIENDADLLNRFRDLLQPGGKLCLLVPANMLLYGSVDKAIGHYRRYDLEQLREMVSAAGLEIVEARYLNPIGMAGWLLNGRILKRTSLPHDQAAVFNTLWPALSLIEKLPLPTGLSVMLVARKPG